MKCREHKRRILYEYQGQLKKQIKSKLVKDLINNSKKITTWVK